MTDSVVTFTNDGAVGTITLNRPPANSYEINFMRDLDAAVETAKGNDAIKVIILRSASAKFFSAGADINGHALGGGLEIVLACDLRFAATGNYRLGLPEVTLGLLPGNGGTQRLPRLIGANKALEMMITGESVGPEEALRLGLVNKLFPADKLLEETEAYAHKVATGASLAIAAIKRTVYDGIHMPLDDALAYEQQLIKPLFDSKDAAEGFKAFAEKRPPVYKGK